MAAHHATGHLSLSTPLPPADGFGDSQILDATNDGIVIADEMGRITYANATYHRITGFREEDLSDKRLWHLLDRQSATTAGEIGRSLRSHGRWRGQLRIAGVGGRTIPTSISISTIGRHRGSEGDRNRNRRRPRYAVIIADISGRLMTDERIRTLGYSDGLTGLANRRNILEQIPVITAVTRQQGRRVGVIFINLDLFSRVNALFGYSAGDMVLSEIASRLLQVVRDTDIVARVGGDEFVVIAPDIDGPADVRNLADRIAGRLLQPINVQDRDIVVTASIGTAIYPDDNQSDGHVLRQADIAMHAAKATGGASVQPFRPMMAAGSSSRLEIETGLHYAMQAGHLRLVYQAKTDLTTGMVTGVEALLRWTHPTLGPIPPAEFIPIAESMGLIVDIGTWVLNTAARQCRLWHDSGMPITMAVNVSALQFADSDIARDVMAALESSGLAARYLEIEVTESALMQRVDEVIATLHKLRSIGVRVSTDDFGTGYSSLAYLNQMPLDTLKVDRTFVSGLDSTDDSMAHRLVGTIIGLGKSLGLKTIAEGVETPAQAARLKTWQCDEIQGFLVSKPVPANEIPALLGRRVLMAG